ncbi:MAG: VCBS repeat-containing protein [Alphaproteobacteria bacterium]
MLALPGPAAAAEVVTLPSNLPVETLAREAGTGPGIAQPAGNVVLTAPDGARMRVVRRNGKLALEAAPPAPAPQAMPAMVPDSIVTRGRENLHRAWLTGPTERYPHGVLGDAVEGSGLALERFDGQVFHYATDGGSVFEDRLARLADLDGDGWDEVIVVQSYLDRGAALAVFALGAESVRFVSEVAPIGTPNRWLNPAGVADYDGDGVIEIAYVQTPHIGGTLKLYAFEQRRLVADHTIGGFSNHAIGSRIQDMAATLDWDGDGLPDLALPDARRRSLRVIGFAGGEARELARIAHPAPIVSAVLPARLSDDAAVSVVYGLADGTLVAVRP